MSAACPTFVPHHVRHVDSGGFSSLLRSCHERTAQDTRSCGPRPLIQRKNLTHRVLTALPRTSAKTSRIASNVRARSMQSHSAANPLHVLQDDRALRGARKDPHLLTQGESGSKEGGWNSWDEGKNEQQSADSGGAKGADAAGASGSEQCTVAPHAKQDAAGGGAAGGGAPSCGLAESSGAVGGDAAGASGGDQWSGGAGGGAPKGGPADSSGKWARNAAYGSGWDQYADTWNEKKDASSGDAAVSEAPARGAADTGGSGGWGSRTCTRCHTLKEGCFFNNRNRKWSTRAPVCTACLDDKASYNKTYKCYECNLEKGREDFFAKWYDWDMPVCEPCCKLKDDENPPKSLCCVKCTSWKMAYFFPCTRRAEQGLTPHWTPKTCMQCLQRMGANLSASKKWVPKENHAAPASDAKSELRQRVGEAMQALARLQTALEAEA